MLRKFVCAAAICAVSLGTAYAHGQKYAVHHAGEPAVSADQGRIYFYRESGILGAAMQPAIKVNGEKVGDSSPGDYFYIDRPPGTYEISATTEKEESISVPLTAGQVVYVKTSVSMGFLVGHVSPEVVASDQAATEIADCDFAGKDAPAGTGTPAATAAASQPATTTASQPAMPAAATQPATPAVPATNASASPKN